MLEDYLRKTLLPILLLSIIFIGCESTKPNETSLSLSFQSESGLQKKYADYFQITEVKLLVRNLKMKDLQDSMQIKTGPLVVNLNLEGEVTEFAASEIPPGSYSRVRFEIHKIEDSETPPDSEFKEGSESSKRYSTIVKGIINGEPFIYRSRKSAVQDIKLEEDLVVEDGADANLTIKVDPFTWFYNGDQFLNPNDNANDDKIDNNLKNSFKRAYCDKDRNGKID
jgi:hypothetical protein